MSPEKENRWKHHPPDEDKVKKHVDARARCRDLAEFLDGLPNGREKSLAETHLEEVMFWANASIARNE